MNKNESKNLPRLTREDEKRASGRFYTKSDVFGYPAFSEWLELVPREPVLRIVEPFAGACHIPAALAARGVNAEWHCFDISPGKGTPSGLDVIKRDTIFKYPKGYSCAITNPPYLAKNSARRRGLPFPQTKHDDIYKLCLEIMLKHTPYVAAIVPESFLTQECFHERLLSVTSLIGKFFDDTECPVCLALFIPDKKRERDFSVWRNDIFLGKMSEIVARTPRAQSDNPWSFNEPAGEIGLYCCDSPKGASIKFCLGEAIPSSDVTESSRSITKISGVPEGHPIERIVDEANAILSEWRTATSDVLMTAFKGLRSDGAYRRRLDFSSARNILNLAIDRLHCFSQERNNARTE